MDFRPINFVIALVFIAVIVTSCGDNRSAQETGNIAQSLSGYDISGFKRVQMPRDFKFPKDFGPHPEYQTEWWYYTGNLVDSSGRDFGYQLTFFRRALSSYEVDRESEWASNQIYFAHFALSDIENGEFYSSERWSRSALGLAGAETMPFRVWIDDWSVQGEGKSFKLKATDGSISINLLLKPAKPVVLQGDKGLSQKSQEPGNASYYFSQTRIDTSGRVIIDGQEFEVRGLSWLDREWSTSALGENQEGWDWFSIQLDDGREIMLYQLRLKDGGIDNYSSGSIVNQNGDLTPLKVADFEIEVLDTWKSSKTGIDYPSKWRISIPGHDIELNVVPLLQDQELLHSFIYWEGAVKISGEGFSGKGYVELTGYDSKD
ncbi:MAG: carotenoid 1,2-hydratase [Candidatus Dadabacteria bacterium]|nr:MAG: carotenoid 1,2-hydratase [Candidatus Dadabacteria bacterium]